MPSNKWDEVLLEQVAEEITVGYVGPMASEYVSTGVPFLRSQNIEQLLVNKKDIKYITPEFHEKIKKSSLSPGDVVIVRTGKPGACAVIPAWLPVANCSDLVIVRCGPNLDSRFLAYYINTSASDHVFAHLVGAVQQHFNVGSARKIRMLLPNIEEQRAIAGILSVLDDKIELNCRMNRTLESIARAVFRQWFVESEEIKKWNELTWGDIATLEYGKSLSNYKDSDAPYAVYGTNGPIGRHTEALYPSEGIIIGRKGAYRGIHYSPDPFFIIETAFYLKPRKPFSMKWAYYELLRFDLNGMDSGSAIPSTSRVDFYNIPVLFPPQELMNSFEEFVTPLFTKMYANDKESRTLAGLRDTLLPKLMRGEVRVRE